MKLNRKSQIALATLALMASSAAFAEVSYNIGAVSDYRFRGIEQTAGQPSLQAGIDFAHASGFYAGAWAASNIKWVKDVNGATDGAYEVDLYGGYKAEIAPGLSYDIGVITYQYPGNNSGAAGTPGAGAYTNASTTELYAGLTYKVVTLKYYQSQGDFLGNKNTHGSRYWDLSATFDLGNGFSLTPHYGLQTIPSGDGNTLDNANYSDYAVTLAKDLGKGLVVSLAAVGTDAKRAFYTPMYGSTDRYLGKDTVVLGLKYNF